MKASYPAKYRDALGEEETIIHNDGKWLWMTLRGVEFRGKMLDDWEPTATPETERLTHFFLYRNELRSYALTFEMPIPVVKQSEILEGTLKIHLELGVPKANGAVDREDLQLELLVDGQAFQSCGKHGWFEDEIGEIQTALPEGAFIKSCFNCAFSDYCPAGYGLFGCMACFRNSKQEYLRLKGKVAYFKLSDQIAEFVQETYLCPEFEKRVPGTGYRG